MAKGSHDFLVTGSSPRDPPNALNGNQGLNEGRLNGRTGSTTILWTGLWRVFSTVGCLPDADAVSPGKRVPDLFVIVPGEACFNCFLRAQDEETIPRPPAGPRSAITPIGCRHPTFSGAGFEATELAAIVSRRAIQATKATSYPGSGCNWMILSFRGAPHFQEGRLDPVPECEIHP